MYLQSLVQECAQPDRVNRTNLVEPSEVYPEELIQQIAETIGVSNDHRIARLRSGLHRMPDDTVRYHSVNVLSNPTNYATRYESVEAACTRLLHAIETDDRTGLIDTAPETICPFHGLILWQVAKDMDPGHVERRIENGSARTALEDLVRAVTKLRGYASAARASVAQNITPGRGGKRHKGDSALQQVLIDLCLLYKEVTDRELGTCVDPFTFEVHGSLIRFLRLCLPPLEWNLSPDAIRAHLRRLPKDSF